MYLAHVPDQPVLASKVWAQTAFSVVLPTRSTDLAAAGACLPERQLEAVELALAAWPLAPLWQHHPEIARGLRLRECR